MNNELTIMRWEEKEVRVEQGSKVNLVDVAKCCGLTKTNGNGKEYVRWNDGKASAEKKYISHIKIFTNDNKTSLMDIVAKATSRNISMTSINEKNVNDILVYDLLIKVSSKEDLDLFINDLEMLKYVDLVKRY